MDCNWYVGDLILIIPNRRSCVVSGGFFISIDDNMVMPSNKKLIPLWALVIGPLWLPLLLIYFIVRSFVFLVWIAPVWVACEVFNWHMPKGLNSFSDESD